jgi:hypothetical protein
MDARGSPAANRSRVASFNRLATRLRVGGIDLTVRAIGRFRGVHHGCDVSEREALVAHDGVDILGNPVWRHTHKPAIEADVVRQLDHGAVVALVSRPSETEGAQLSEVCAIRGIGSRNRSASNQSSASHKRDGQPREPAR